MRGIRQGSKVPSFQAVELVVVVGVTGDAGGAERHRPSGCGVRSARSHTRRAIGPVTTHLRAPGSRRSQATHSVSPPSGCPATEGRWAAGSRPRSARACRGANRCRSPQVRGGHRPRPRPGRRGRGRRGRDRRAGRRRGRARTRATRLGRCHQGARTSPWTGGLPYRAGSSSGCATIAATTASRTAPKVPAPTESSADRARPSRAAARPGRGSARAGPGGPGAGRATASGRVVVVGQDAGRGPDVDRSCLGELRADPVAAPRRGEASGEDVPALVGAVVGRDGFAVGRDLDPRQLRPAGPRPGRAVADRYPAGDAVQHPAGRVGDEHVVDRLDPVVEGGVDVGDGPRAQQRQHRRQPDVAELGRRRPDHEAATFLGPDHGDVLVVGHRVGHGPRDVSGVAEVLARRARPGRPGRRRRARRTPGRPAGRSRAPRTPGAGRRRSAASRSGSARRRPRTRCCPAAARRRAARRAAGRGRDRPRPPRAWWGSRRRGRAGRGRRRPTSTPATPPAPGGRRARATSRPRRTRRARRRRTRAKNSWDSAGIAAKPRRAVPSMSRSPARASQALRAAERPDPALAPEPLDGELPGAVVRGDPPLLAGEVEQGRRPHVGYAGPVAADAHLAAAGLASVPAKISDSAWSARSTICSVLRSWSRLRQLWANSGRSRS